MTVEQILADLIQRSYGNAEVERHRAYRPSEDLLKSAAQVGSTILQNRPRDVVSGDCRYLSAMWVAKLRDELNAPAFCVAGHLYARGRMAFGSADPEVAKQLAASRENWDGHCWIMLGGYLGDISIFRSAYAAPEGSNLRAVVIEKFGYNRGLFLKQWSEVGQWDLEYCPKHVATETEITGLINGARTKGQL